MSLFAQRKNPASAIPAIKSENNSTTRSQSSTVSGRETRKSTVRDTVNDSDSSSNKSYSSAASSRETRRSAARDNANGSHTPVSSKEHSVRDKADKVQGNKVTCSGFPFV